MNHPRELYLELYHDLFNHLPYFEEMINRLFHAQPVEKEVLEKHLTQMIASIATALKTLSKKKSSPKNMDKQTFNTEMLRVTKIVKSQLTVLLKTSFLLEHSHVEKEYIQTLSDVCDNISRAFQHVVRTNVLIPVTLN
jgi:hypothetical protein